MRLFVCVRPPAPVLVHLGAALDAVRAARSRQIASPVDESVLRWAPQENWHLTLAFFGEVPDGRVEELTAAVRGVAAAGSAFAIRLRGAGVFAQRTVWVGAAGELDRIRALSAELCRAGEQAGGRADDRVRSRPHLTVGRVRPGAPPGRRRNRRGPQGSEPAGDPAADLVRALAVYEGPEWAVDTVALTQSRPGEGRGGGPLYRDEAVLPFGPG